MNRRHVLTVVVLFLIIGGYAVYVTDDMARQRALAQEETYLETQLMNASCVEEWGLTDYGGIEREATVIDRSVDGIYVKVTHPYWYGTGELVADTGSEATYRVTDDEIKRLSGTQVFPC